MLEGEEPACGGVGPALVAKRRAMDAGAAMDANDAPTAACKTAQTRFRTATTAFILFFSRRTTQRGGSADRCSRKTRFEVTADTCRRARAPYCIRCAGRDLHHTWFVGAAFQLRQDRIVFSAGHGAAVLVRIPLVGRGSHLKATAERRTGRLTATGDRALPDSWGRLALILLPASGPATVASTAGQTSAVLRQGSRMTTSGPPRRPRTPRGPASSVRAASTTFMQMRPGRATLPSMSTTDRLTLIGIALATVIAIVTMVNGNVNARVGDLRADVNTRLDRLESRMDTRMDGFDARLRAVEIAFGKVDQRLATLERAIIPAAPPAE